MIVETLAKERMVESMIENIAHQPLSPDLKDLSQMIYLILLEYDEDKIIDLWEHKQMQFFIARIIVNQFRSSNSPFHAIYRKHQERQRGVGLLEWIQEGIASYIERQNYNCDYDYDYEAGE